MFQTQLEHINSRGAPERNVSVQQEPEVIMKGAKVAEIMKCYCICNILAPYTV